MSRTIHVKLSSYQSCTMSSAPPLRPYVGVVSAPLTSRAHRVIPLFHCHKAGHRKPWIRLPRREQSGTARRSAQWRRPLQLCAANSRETVEMWLLREHIMWGCNRFSIANETLGKHGAPAVNSPRVSPPLGEVGQQATGGE